jgi:RNA polymerase sigma factor (sigma-70 family)
VERSSTIEEAYRAHGHHVLRRASRILGNDADAREVLQEVFMSLVAEPGQFTGRSSLSTWLYSATTHLALNRLRNQRTRARILQTESRSDSHEPPADAAIDLRRVLARLPEDLARVAVHYYLDEMTQEEIATVMKCSRKHVGHLLRRLEIAGALEAAS